MGRKSNSERERGPLSEGEDKRQGYIAGGLLVLAAGLGFGAFFVSDEMLIPNKTMWLTILAGSLVAITIFFLAWRKYIDRWGLGRVWAIVLILFYGVITGGPISYFAINTINYYFEGDGVTEQITLDLLETGNHSRGTRSRKDSCREPYAIIKLHNIEHTITFSCEYEFTISEYKQVDLMLTKGYLGFYVIMDRQLRK